MMLLGCQPGIAAPYGTLHIASMQSVTQLSAMHDKHYLEFTVSAD